MKRVLVVSDLHVGSDVGLMPNTVSLGDGERRRIIHANRIQREIYSLWRQMIKRVGHVDICVCNGDLCDGVNRKSKGLGLWTSDLNVQVDIAVKLLKEINADKYIGTQGSLYHVEDNMSTDYAVLDKLGGKCYDEVKLKVDSINMHFCHKVGTSSSAWFYRPTPVAREMMLAALTKQEYGDIDIVVRSHAHYFCYVGYPNSLGVITPCWKGRDGFASRQTMAYTPAIGAVYFDIDGDEYTWDYMTGTLKGEKIIETVTA